MTAFLPRSVAHFLSTHGTIAESLITGSIGVTLLIALLVAREFARAASKRGTEPAALRAMDAVTLPLLVVVAVVIVQRFLALK